MLMHGVVQLSRSYKKTPIVKLFVPYGKKFATRRVRRFKGDIKRFSGYKRLYSRYMVIDCKFYRNKPDSHEKEDVIFWSKGFRWK